MIFESEIIRLAFDVESLTPQFDDITGQNPEMWRNNDVTFQLGFFYKGAPITATYNAVKLLVKEIENRAASSALMNKSIAAGEITPVFTSEEWSAGSKQHCAISFSAAETRLDLRGANDRTFWLSVIGTTAGGKRVTLGSTLLKMHHDGEDETSISPPVGSSLVPNGATYNGAGVYVLNGLTAGRSYYYAKGANDTKVVNGTEELAVNGRFEAVGSSVTLHGTVSALITATLRWPVYLTLEEQDARYQRFVTPWAMSPNKKYIRIFGVDDNKVPIDQIETLP